VTGCPGGTQNSGNENFALCQAAGGTGYCKVSGCSSLLPHRTVSRGVQLSMTAGQQQVAASAATGEQLPRQ
jgi:hypothetical protein